MSVRRALSVFDDDALIGLANKGLLRRALKAVEAGKAEVAEEGADELKVSVTPETVTLTKAGPSAATCTCPASGICQHILAAVVVVRGDDTEGNVSEGDDSDAKISADPLAEVLQLAPEELKRWAGVGPLRAAMDLAGEAVAEVSGGSLIIKVGDLPEVRFMSGMGLEGAVCKAPEARRKAYVATAILSVWKANNIVVPDDYVGPKGGAAAAGGQNIDAAYLSRVAKTLEDAAATGLARAPLSLEDRLFSLAVSGRADALPRLAASLRRLANLIAQARVHHVDYSAEELLGSIAACYALVKALSHDPQDTVLRGVVRKSYVEVGELGLIGFGANAWRTKSGARGVTSFFFDPAAKSWRTATLSRIGSADAFFDPRSAYGNHPIWGSGTLSVVCKSRVRLTKAQVAEGRLSLSEKTRGQLEPVRYDWEAASDLPAVLNSWRELEAMLARRNALSLKAPFATRAPIILEPAVCDKPFFDERTQEALWPLCDQEGRWLALAVSASEDGAARLDAIEYHMQTVTPRYVLATAMADGNRWRLSPYGVIVERAGEMVLANLDFDELSATTRRRWWWSYLNSKKKPEHGFEQTARFSAVSSVSQTDRLLSEALNLAVTIAQFGSHVTTEELAAEAVQLGRQFQAGGLNILSDLMAPLSVVGPVPPERLLALSYAVKLAAANRTRLAFLTPAR
ncbi:MAG: SWIM zinc finger domain-containing protein [Alphaproteobacteria bacterium]|nr:SWIM zinc finger domain-containing protein [Alphaproteobacteria bacterium]